MDETQFICYGGVHTNIKQTGLMKNQSISLKQITKSIRYSPKTLDEAHDTRTDGFWVSGCTQFLVLLLQILLNFLHLNHELLEPGLSLLTALWLPHHVPIVDEQHRDWNQKGHQIFGHHFDLSGDFLSIYTSFLSFIFELLLFFHYILARFFYQTDNVLKLIFGFAS